MAAAQQSRSRWVLPEIFTAGWEFWARIEKILYLPDKQKGFT
jgi:hypothetical protein